ncbi:ATP-dependent protease subunit HslV [Candidatus Deianiraea vastatrix]|uniref:ATP-dependent protease subunit HslV n=1 Tax=Candidatus Deianiraea vastatrix TaxID=2163644 RepID=A0A5B8XDK5_9RICK|nr:ATP-dependent protease subunit HslV [Candidatus Deianiraea vastatrix]QED23439.1 ATP-dependent protease subunit HslV [Candidatus Deianiraea vastatrix]
MSAKDICATTICCVRKGKMTAIAGDGQVTFGKSVIMKNNAKKLRKLRDGKVLVGFAGGATDGITLVSKLEAELEKHDGKLLQSCVELSKNWRGDKVLRELDAMMIVADKDSMFIVAGNGDVVEPENDVVAIGSGGNFAYSAALALLQTDSKLNALEIARKSLEIAGQICVYTNNNISSEVIE